MLGMCIPDQLEAMTALLLVEAQMCLSTASQFVEWETPFPVEILCVRVLTMFLLMDRT
jgi:hypothetical protein